MSDVEKPARERWGSKIAFIMAAVGFAVSQLLSHVLVLVCFDERDCFPNKVFILQVGFGNVWRFPSLAYEYGGGAFFIPYIMALLFVGMPLVTLEVSLGQYHQTGDVGVFGSIHRRLKGVGLGSVIAGWAVVTYYVPLIAWVVHAFFDSFTSDSIWQDSNVNATVTYAYFLDEIVGEKTLGPDSLPTRMVWANVGYVALTWSVIWLCLAWGIKTTGRITYVTMGLPAILIFVFLGRAVMLPGSETGIHAYIGEWDVSVLVQRPDCWSRAVSQIFYSVGVTFVSTFIPHAVLASLCNCSKTHSYTLLLSSTGRFNRFWFVQSKRWTCLPELHYNIGMQ